MTAVMVAAAVTVLVAELFINASFNYVVNSSYCTEQRFPNFLGSRRPKAKRYTEHVRVLIS
jgi:hypothetical protein